MKDQRPASHYVVDARVATPHFPGIRRYAVRLLHALQRELAPAEQLSALCRCASDLPSDISSVTVPDGVFSLRQQATLPRMLKRLGADLYHSLYVAFPYSTRRATVCTIHDLIPLLYPEQSSTRAARLFPVLLRLALRKARHILTVSASTRDDLHRHLHVPLERMTVTPLAPGQRFQPQPEAVVARLRTRLELPPSYALYVGSNKAHKNLVRLMEAWALVQARSSRKDGVLVVAGAWDPRYPEARERTAVLGLKRSVRFLGFVADEDLPALYGGARLFVFPSLYEGFGLPVIEAMACGTPVACSRSSSLPEVGGEAAQYFDPLDVAAMAATLLALLEDDTLHQTLAARSLEQAARFSWQATARRTLNVYRRVVSAS